MLVGSGSVAKNELIAQWLDKAGIKYEILNAKNNEREGRDLMARWREGDA